MRYRLSAAIISLFVGITPMIAHGSEYVGNEPRSLQRSLFDVRAFRLQVRMKRAFPTIESGSVLRTTKQPTVINAAATDVDELTTDDLSISERDTLRRQLHGGACPQDALIGYRTLCEKLLKLRPVPKVHKTLINIDARGGER